MKDIESSLRKRLKSNVDETLSIVLRYDLKPTIRDFDGNGLTFKDSNKKTVRVLSGKYRDDVIHLPRIIADVIVVFVDEMCLGWIDWHDLLDAQDMVMAKTKMLHPMPVEFAFNATCPHLEEYGGFLENNYFSCANCGTLIKAHVDG